MKNTMYIIYSQRLAGYLMCQGFTLIQIVRNIESGKNNFLFRDSEPLQQCIAEWSRRR